jgi:hypothetical protein
MGGSPKKDPNPARQMEEDFLGKRVSELTYKE